MFIKRKHGEALAVKLSTGEWYIMYIKVDDGFRGRGIGTKLMQRILKECGRPVYLLATSELGGDLVRLVQFYERFGFRTIERHQSEFLDYNANMVLES